MANPHRGEVSFDASGNTYVLQYSIDSLATLEREFGRLEGKSKVPIHQIFSELSDIQLTSINGIRLALWAGLREHHPDIDLKSAGELIISAGGANAIFTRVVEAIGLAFPTDGDSGHPQKPSQNGNGSAS